MVKMKRRRDIDDDDAIFGPVAHDGETVRVPMQIMDGDRVHLTDTVRYENHKPHFLRSTDAGALDALARARDARQAMIDRNANAWKGGASGLPSSSKPDFSAADARAGARAAYNEMVQRLGDAWRTPVRGDLVGPLNQSRDAAQPDMGTPPEELMRRHTRTDPDDNAQRRRDQAWNDYESSLSNAWRSPTPGTIRAEPAMRGVGPNSLAYEQPSTGRTDPTRATGVERQREAFLGKSA
jgi:hypothetical protein